MRTTLFILLLLIAFYAPLPISALVVFCYALRYRAYEMVLLGALVDIAFGHVTFTEIPAYTFAFGTIVLIVELAKPSFTFYNTEHGSL